MSTIKLQFLPESVHGSKNIHRDHVQKAVSRRSYPRLDAMTFTNPSLKGVAG